MVSQRKLFLVGLLIIFSAAFYSQSVRQNVDNKEQNIFEGNKITSEGAWCWFADPRALHYQNESGTINNTYIGYIDVHGNIKATQQNFNTGKNNEVLIRSYFQPDDHDSPSFLVLPDERIMIFYSRHTDEACFYYRISKKPGDITSLGTEKKLITADNTTYPSPFILSDDPDHIYLCWRGINWHPTIARISIPDENDDCNFDWGPYQMIQSTGARPYCKYYSNGKDKIYLTYTTGHPDNEYPNYVYFNYVDINTKQLKDIQGTTLSTIANGVHNVNKTTYPSSYPYAVVDTPTDQRDWVWQATLDTDGNPVIAMVQISNDKNTHNYYYVKWTGNSWRKTFLAYGGGKFHQSAGLELCYSGGMAIDDQQPNIVYCSVPVVGDNGTVYELKKFTVDEKGDISSTEQITSNSSLNNVRPYCVQNSGDTPLKLVWMHGNYYDWIVSSSCPKGFCTAIHSEWALPAYTTNLERGLLVDEKFTGDVNGTAYTTDGVLVSTAETSATITVTAPDSFSVSLTPYIYEGAYSGTIFKMGNITYGLNGTTQKPYVKIGHVVYNSQNLLGTSDVWQTTSRGTGGVWYTPTKLQYFNLSMTYENGTLKIYRNGLIDQSISVDDLTLGDVILGGFVGWIEDCRIYSRAINQDEVKQLTAISSSYTFDSSLSGAADLESLSVPQNIYTDVVLPTTTSSGTTVSWTSSNTSLISNTGLVTLSLTETNVTLTATVSGKSKNFNVVIHPRDITQNKKIAYKFETEDEYTLDGQRYVSDKSGKGNDAAVYGSAVIDGTLNTTANTASGFSTNGYAMAPAGMLNDLRSYSFLVKIKPASLANQPRILDFGSASTNSLLLRANAFTAGFKYNGGTTTLINSSSSLAVGREDLIALTYDAKTKTTKIYLNGSQTANSTSIAYEPYQLTEIGSNSRNYIGRTQWWDTSVASDNIDFNGTIDDFYVYDIALTNEEIIQIQNDNETGLISIGKQQAFFPNPVGVNSKIKITSSLSFSKYELTDISGRIIYSNNLTGNIIPAIHQKGLYILRLFPEHTNLLTYQAKLLVH
ncbi:MAG: BNR-4 repeat-containing protein [Paludibacter sp.]|nr:BNR-4 repeat-containing protein [Paludibacter sp.]